jgi:hypothetical protein
MSYKITDTVIVDQNKNIGSIGIASFAGPVIIGGGTSTGTVSQPLQVTGSNGAYIGGNLGIGSTNPSSKLSVIGDATFSGIVTSSGLNVRKDPGTGIATDFTNSLLGNGWRLSAPGSTTYYLLATLPAGGGGNTFDHLRIEGTLGAWTNDNQTPFDISFSNRGAFDYKYISYGSVRSDVRIVGISTNSTIQIWAQHQASVFTKLVYNITESIQAIVVSNPTSTTTAPTGTTVFDSSSITPRFIINESGNVGIGTNDPTVALQLSQNASISNLNTNTNFGTTAGAAATVAQFYHLNGNASYLRIKATRNTAGADWTTASTKLVQVIDVTEQGYIEYNPNGANYGMAFGQGGSEWARFLQNGNLGIGTTNPTSKLHVVGNVLVSGIVTATTFVGNLTGTATTAGIATYATSSGIATYATSAGIATYATTSGVSTSVIGGIGSLTQLQVTGISTFTNGPVFIGAATSTGTASQRLQVTGGAYVSSNVGIAVTSPSFAVDVSGDARVQSTGKMRFGGTAGTTNFYIQYNSTANSLDFVAG